MKCTKTMKQHQLLSFWLQRLSRQNHHWVRYTRTMLEYDITTATAYPRTKAWTGTRRDNAARVEIFTHLKEWGLWLETQALHGIRLWHCQVCAIPGTFILLKDKHNCSFSGLPCLCSAADHLVWWAFHLLSCRLLNPKLVVHFNFPVAEHFTKNWRDLMVDYFAICGWWFLHQLIKWWKSSVKYWWAWETIKSAVRCIK